MRKVILSLALIITCCSGCVRFPDDPASSSIEASELRSHTEFLASDALGGRKPNTRGSSRARKYLCNRFKAIGLMPWGQEKSYEQKFPIGTNIIGVLPGSDPNLTDEYIIVAAHYDHLGKTEQGICLGACDNASGVAALLEIAESLSLGNVALSRPVCLALFDCEEMGMIGAFFFASREDFEPDQIKAFINIDALGRSGYDVLDKHLFVIGLNQNSGLYEKLIQQSSASDIQILSAAIEMAGYRGDYVPFKALGIPSLCVTCGLYEDYHQPTDTADKLDYDKMQASAEITKKIIEVLANTDEHINSKEREIASIEDLYTIQVILDRLIEDFDTLRFDEKYLEDLCKLRDAASLYMDDKEPYTSEKKRMIAYKVMEFMCLYEQSVNPPVSRMLIRSIISNPQSQETTDLNAIDTSEPKSVIQDTNSSPKIANFRLSRRVRNQIFIGLEDIDFIDEAIRGVIEHLKKHKPGILKKMPVFDYEKHELLDKHLVLSDIGDRQYRLVYVTLNGRVRIEQPDLLELGSSSPISMSLDCDWENMTGTIEEITDVILLKKIGQAWTDIDNRIMRYITKNAEPQNHQRWLDYRLEQGGWDSQQQWVLDRMQCSNPLVVYYAIPRGEVGDQVYSNILCKIVQDTARPVWQRISAASMFQDWQKKNQQKLLALAGIINDDTLFELRYPDQPLPEEHPLKTLAMINREADMQENVVSKTTRNISSLSLGDWALLGLKRFTNQDFGKDADAWCNWIEANTQ